MYYICNSYLQLNKHYSNRNLRWRCWALNYYTTYHHFVYLQIDDFLYIHRLAHTSRSIAVIGGGFLGSELACALGYKGQSVLCLFVCLMVLNTTFNNISVISWQSVLLVEETVDQEKTMTCRKSMTNFIT